MILYRKGTRNLKQRTLLSVNFLECFILLALVEILAVPDEENITAGALRANKEPVGRRIYSEEMRNVNAEIKPVSTI